VTAHDSIEERIEDRGVESVVKEVLSSLKSLDKTERKERLAELAAACGVHFRDDESAWREWLDTLKEKGLSESGPLPQAASVSLPADADMLADVMKLGVEDEQGGLSNADSEHAGDGGRLARGYKLLAEIGRGGMATVYKAVQLQLDRVVALKILSAHLAGDKTFVRRFLREAKLAATLSHPNIVAVYDVGQGKDRYYLAMEYVEGETLSDLVKREGPLPEARALSIIRQMADALEHARARELIHRDVKPGNILISADGAAKLADMGLARSVSTTTTQKTQGLVMGTPSYIAPEQASGERDLDTRTDIYALGATFFYAVTGQPPFDGDTVAAVIRKHLLEPAPLADSVNPEVTRGTSLVIRKCMEKERGQRYQTPGEMTSDVQDIVQGRPPRIAVAHYKGTTPAWAGSVGAAWRRFAGSVRSSPTEWAIGAGSLLAVGMLCFFLWLGLLPADQVPANQVETGGPDAGAVVVPGQGQERQGLAYEKLMEEARVKMAEGRYDPAMDLLTQAQAMRDTPTVRDLLADAGFGKHRAAGQEAEERGEIPSAVDSYDRALDIKADGELAAHVAELRRRMRLAAILQRADRLRVKGEFRDALTGYREALRIARGPERGEVDERISKIDKGIRYAEAIAKAGEALEGRAWREAERQARAALEIMPGDARAEPILRKALAQIERERKAYDQAIARANAAAGKKDWDAVLAHANTALGVRPEDKRARALIESAREAKRGEAHAAAMSKADEAKRAGKWDRVLAHATEALAARPDDGAATRLAGRARAELSLKPRIRNSLGMEFVLVSASEFAMGNDRGEVDERPARKVYLDSHYIGVHEVTNTQFAAFRPDHGKKWRDYSPDDDMPAVCVSWDDTIAFCRWLSDREGVEYRLPTEAEWEKAARGTDGRTYPWGNQRPNASLCAFAADGRGKARQAGAVAVAGRPDGASPYGAKDMAGNVWEWCLDWYAPGYAADAGTNPRGPDTGTKRVLRGGSFTNSAEALRAANRAAHFPRFCNANVGFRVVRIPTDEASRGGPAGTDGPEER